MGKKIVYDTGTAQEYDLAYGTVKLAIAPAMVGEMRTAIKKLEELSKKLKNIKPEEASSIETDMRENLNKAFGTDICTPAFGNMSVFTVTKSGKFLFEEFFDAFIPELENDLKAMKVNISMRAKELRPEVKKYIEPASKPIVGLAQPYGSGIPDVSGLTPEQKKALAIQLLS